MHTDRYTYRQTDTQTDCQTQRLTDAKTNRQSDRLTDWLAWPGLTWAEWLTDLTDLTGLAWPDLSWLTDWPEQLNVACSRVGKPDNLYVCTDNGTTKNTVYSQALSNSGYIFETYAFPFLSFPLRWIHIIRNVKVTSTSHNGPENYHPIYFNTHGHTLTAPSRIGRVWTRIFKIYWMIICRSVRWRHDVEFTYKAL